MLFLLLFLQLLRQHVTPKSKSIFFFFFIYPPSSLQLVSITCKVEKAEAPAQLQVSLLITHDAEHCLITFRRKSYLQTINIFEKKNKVIIWESTVGAFHPEKPSCLFYLYNYSSVHCAYFFVNVRFLHHESHNFSCLCFSYLVCFTNSQQRRQS